MGTCSRWLQLLVLLAQHDVGCSLVQSVGHAHAAARRRPMMLSCKAHRMPRDIVFVPSSSLSEKQVQLAQMLEGELSTALQVCVRKQAKLNNAEQCMAVYVDAPMLVKAERLAQWSRLVLSNLRNIPKDAESVVLFDEAIGGGEPVTLRFSRDKYVSPEEEALAHANMAEKLQRQQAKVDGLRHRNSGTEMALRGWQKRVRFAAARGEAAALGALRVKLLQSSKKLGLRSAKLASYSEYDHSDLGI